MILYFFIYFMTVFFGILYFDCFYSVFSMLSLFYLNIIFTFLIRPEVKSIVSSPLQDRAMPNMGRDIICFTNMPVYFLLHLLISDVNWCMSRLVYCRNPNLDLMWIWQIMKTSKIVCRYTSINKKWWICKLTWEATQLYQLDTVN